MVRTFLYWLVADLFFWKLADNNSHEFVGNVRNLYGSVRFCTRSLQARTVQGSRMIIHSNLYGHIVICTWGREAKTAHQQENADLTFPHFRQRSFARLRESRARGVEVYSRNSDLRGAVSRG